MTPTVRLLGFTRPMMESAVIDADGTLMEIELAANDGLAEPLDLIEFAGRWDYGPRSIAKMGDRDIIRRWIAAGEESMLEMVDAVFLVTCSRVVSHELVRHRLASFQQESQRFVSYRDEEPDALTYMPPEIEGDKEDEYIYRIAMEHAIHAYNALVYNGVPKQIARYVLPNATRTRIVVKANLREWRHILSLRMHSSAQPEMRLVAKAIYAELVGLFPEVFEGLDEAERGVR